MFNATMAVDKLGLAIPPADEDCGNWEHLVASGAYELGGWSKAHPKHDWRMAFIPCGPHKETIEFGYGFTPHGPRASFRANPAKVSPHDVRTLVISALGPVTGPTFLSKGKVKEIHLAVDVEDAPFADYWFIDPRLKCSNAVYEDDGTMYLGGKKGLTGYAIYDKNKEQGSMLPWHLLRVELKCGRTGLNVGQLWKLPNRLTRLMVLDRSSVENRSHLSPVHEFLSGIGAGKSAQAAFRTSSNRKLLKEVLASCRPAWWEPEQMWKAMLPAALARLAPLVAESVHSLANPPLNTAIAAGATKHGYSGILVQ